MKKHLILGLAAAIVGALGPTIAGWVHPDVHFNFGPSDERYLQGFEPMWEIDPDGMATHWSSYESIVRLPVRPTGRARVSYRFARIYRETAQVEVRINGVPADRFSATGGAYEARSVEVPSSVLAKGPFEFQMKVDSHERRNRGLRMDWLHVEIAGSRGRLAPAVYTVLWCAVLSLAFAVLVGSTLEKEPLLALAAPLGLGLYGALAGPFPLAHMVRFVAPSGIVLSILLLVVHRAVSKRWKAAGSEWLPLLVLSAFTLRAGGVFHPRYYHPDLRAHADMTRIVGEAGLEFWNHPSQYIAEQGVWTAESMGKMYAFPFSPVFHALFVPLGWGLLSTMDAMKLVICFLSCFEVPIVFFLARRLGGDRAAVWSAALTVVSPPVLSRLSLAFMAALFAHFWETLVLLSVAARRTLSLVLAFVFLLVALGSYAGSLINFGLFLPLLGAALLVSKETRKTALTLLGGSALVAAVVLALVYREFLGTFFSEILPRFVAGKAERGEWSLLAFSRMLFHRTWTFYDAVYIPFLIGGGVLWLRRRTDGFALRFVGAWALAYVVLIYFRTVAPDLFAKVKEMLWVAPLVSILSAETLAWMRQSLPGGKGWAVAAYLGLAVYGVHFYAGAVAATFALAR